MAPFPKLDVPWYQFVFQLILLPTSVDRIPKFFRKRQPVLTLDAYKWCNYIFIQGSVVYTDCILGVVKLWLSGNSRLRTLLGIRVSASWICDSAKLSVLLKQTKQAEVYKTKGVTHTILINLIITDYQTHNNHFQSC